MANGTLVLNVARVETTSEGEHMTSTVTGPRASSPSFRAFDAGIERLIGADFRLLYGMAVPILGMCALLVALAFYPHAWLVGLIVVIEIASLGLVVKGFMAIMSDDEDDGHHPLG
jgi:hypothetical protein